MVSSAFVTAVRRLLIAVLKHLPAVLWLHIDGHWLLGCIRGRARLLPAHCRPSFRLHIGHLIQAAALC